MTLIKQFEKYYKSFWIIGFYIIAARFFLSSFGVITNLAYIDDLLLLLGLGFLFLAYLVKDSSLKIKAIQLILIILGIISYLLSKETIMLQVMLTIVSCDKIENEELAKIYLIFVAPIITILFIYTMIGTVVGYSLHTYAQIADDYVCGFYLGTKNMFSDFLVSIAMAILCLNKTGKPFNTITFLIFAFITYHFQRSKADTLILIILILITYIPKDFTNKYIDKLISISMPIITIICVWLIIVFIYRHGFIETILYKYASTVYVRFMCGHKFFDRYGITIFGRKLYESIRFFDTVFLRISNPTLDSFYAKALVSYGSIFLIILNILFYLAIKKLNKENKRNISLMLFICSIQLVIDLLYLFPPVGFMILLFKNGFNYLDDDKKLEATS